MTCLGKRKDIQEPMKGKNSYKTVWILEPTGAWGVNVNNASEFPPFVLKAVKVYLLKKRNHSLFSLSLI